MQPQILRHHWIRVLQWMRWNWKRLYVTLLLNSMHDDLTYFLPNLFQARPLAAAPVERSARPPTTSRNANAKPTT